MLLQEMYYIAEMVVGIAVIISIIFVAIELRQNTFMVRQSMADQRKQRVNWMFETLVTDGDFRKFHRRIDSEFDSFDSDERDRALFLGARTLRSILDELVTHFEGQISRDEFMALEWNMKVAASRPHVQKAYELIKESYPARVQKYWESLDLDAGSKLRQEVINQ